MKNKLKILSLIIGSVFGLTGCGFDLQKEIDKIALDGKISKNEFLQLQKNATKEEGLSKFENSSEFYRYMLKYLDAKKVNVKVWNPNNTILRPFNINVFFENSFSMDGYIYQANLKSSLYNMLVNAKQLTKVIKLNFINSNVIPVPSNNIMAFSTGLNPAAFQKLGGKRGVSDIAEVVKKVLAKTDRDNASILISDFVFSPPKALNALSYLNIQQIAIKEAFSNRHNIAVAIFQMKAYFQGDYYDHKLNTIRLSGIDRPYYIWVIGTRDQVSLAISKQLISEKDPHLINKVVFATDEVSPVVRYKVVNKGKIGDYEFEKTNEISNAKSQDNEFGFGLAVDFGQSLKGHNYFLDSSVYRINDSDYSVTVRSLSDKELASSALSSYTHLLSFKTKKLKSGDLVINILDRVPAWVFTKSSIDDSAIKNNTLEQQKTFGLSYLINGVAEAFSIQAKPSIADLKIKIQR